MSLSCELPDHFVLILASSSRRGCPFETPWRLTQPPPPPPPERTAWPALCLVAVPPRRPADAALAASCHSAWLPTNFGFFYVAPAATCCTACLPVVPALRRACCTAGVPGYAVPPWNWLSSPLGLTDDLSSSSRLELLSSAHFCGTPPQIGSIMEHLWISGSGSSRRVLGAPCGAHVRLRSVPCRTCLLLPTFACALRRGAGMLPHVRANSAIFKVRDFACFCGSKYVLSM